MDPVEAAALGDPDAVAAVKAAIADHHAGHPDRPPRGRIVIALVEVAELPVARPRPFSMAVPLHVVRRQRLPLSLRDIADLPVGIGLHLVRALARFRSLAGLLLGNRLRLMHALPRCGSLT